MVFRECVCVCGVCEGRLKQVRGGTHMLRITECPLIVFLKPDVCVCVCVCVVWSKMVSVNRRECVSKTYEISHLYIFSSLSSFCGRGRRVNLEVVRLRYHVWFMPTLNDAFSELQSFFHANRPQLPFLLA